jgi:hypothetical protein
VSRDGRNSFGQAYSLTVLTPILDGHGEDLAGHLASLPDGAGSPLARVPGTHFARWVVIDQLVYEGGGQRRDSLKAARLLFTSNFDGSRDAYLEAVRTEMGDEADAIWSHCAGYPGRSDGHPFAAWFRSHQVDSALFFAAYGDQSVERVKANLDLRTRLAKFALAAQGLPPEELKAGFQAEFPP